MFSDRIKEIKTQDPDLYELIVQEEKRQNNSLELIPSENIVSPAVLEAMGSVLTNKYSEGYPKKRYYGGNEIIDEIELIAIDRAKKLFGSEYANVQPYSGSPANQAVFFALMDYKDKFMGLELAQGGHITHGLTINFSGKFYTPIPYHVDKETEMLDYDVIEKMAKENKPKMILSGFTAYPRQIDFKRFKEICDQVDAYSFADISHISGLCCTGVHENPTPYFDVVMTTTHKTLRGPRGAMILCKEELGAKIDKAVFPGLQGGPHDHITAAKAIAFEEAAKPEFKTYAEQIIKNAKALAEELMNQDIKLVSNGTDNHLILIDLRPQDIPGKTAEEAMDRAGLHCNKNTVPYDTRSPFNPSGLRIGTPSITTRGLKEPEMKQIGEWMAKVIKNIDDTSVQDGVRKEVEDLCKQFTIYS